MACFGGIDDRDKPDGECPECGAETLDGDSITICSYSPVICSLCGDAPCDQSC